MELYGWYLRGVAYFMLLHITSNQSRVKEEGNKKCQFCPEKRIRRKIIEHVQLTSSNDMDIVGLFK